MAKLLRQTAYDIVIADLRSEQVRPAFVASIKSAIDEAWWDNESLEDFRAKLAEAVAARLLNED